jgi:hypothetical protein
VYNDEKEIYYKKYRVLTREKLKQKEFKKEQELGYHRLYWVHAIYLASYQGMPLEEFSATGNFYEASQHGLESGLDMCERQVYAQVRNKYGFATGAEISLLHYDIGYRREYLLSDTGRWSRHIDENNDEQR